MLAASAGANPRKLTDRMGHENERAAMIYLHGSGKRQRAIADSPSQLASDELKRGSKRNATRPRAGRSGTKRGRKRREAS